MGVASVFEWLVDGAPGAASSPEVVERVATGLRAEGIPVDRMAAFVTTLHPNVLGRAFYWNPDEPVRVGELTPAMLRSEDVANSPALALLTSREEKRLPVDAASPYSIIRDLAAEGFTDYIGLPMRFTSGECHALTFATRRRDGFSNADVEVLRNVVRPLARVGEILALRRTAANILSTYVGRDSGERILAGRIFKGDIETIRAVIWFSDLRGFTEMSSTKTPREVIDTLNELFDVQVPAIQQRGGEVLKFIGDGLLAIFPCSDADATRQSCDAALDAAEAVFAALPERLRIGVGLHVGEVAYGNVGGASRLDFTAIGAPVNLASRLEGLTGKLGRRVLVSQAFAAHSSRDLLVVGDFELKGVPGAQTVLSPR